MNLAIENGPSKGNIIASQAEGLVQAMELPGYPWTASECGDDQNVPQNVPSSGWLSSCYPEL